MEELELSIGWQTPIFGFVRHPVGDSAEQTSDRLQDERSHDRYSADYTDDQQ